MLKYLNNLLFLFPVMFYFLLESLLVSVFITAMWTMFLKNWLGGVDYIQVASIYWITKMLFFNIFNLLPAPAEQPQESDVDDYNESITE